MPKLPNAETAEGRNCENCRTPKTAELRKLPNTETAEDRNLLHRGEPQANSTICRQSRRCDLSSTMLTDKAWR
jgi:hypothetical protein